MIPRSSRADFSLSLFLLAGLVSPTPAPAQCSTQWLPGGASIPGTDSDVGATCLWDRDGPGPLQPIVAIGGLFVAAGAVPAFRVAAFDPASGSWSALGSGMDGAVGCLTTLPNGDLVAGGAFSTAGGVPCNRIARWNGTNWLPLGTGISGGASFYVRALTTLPNGDLVAAGRFTSAGGVSVNHIASWDGTNWSALGTGMSGGPPWTGTDVIALTTLPNGDLVAGGNFTVAGGVSASRIARWNGSSWSILAPTPDLQINDEVYALTALSNGDLVAGGFFTTAGGVSCERIARWNGTNWSALGTGMSGSTTVFALTPLPNGDLVAGGYFTVAGGVSANGIARWNGTSWSALGSGVNDIVGALTALPNGDLVAGGNFSVAGGVSANNIARWNGASWSALGPSILGQGINGDVYALTALSNGDLVAGGSFSVAGGVGANNIARWNGTSWSALGSGMNNKVHALTTLPNGDLVAGGYFTTAGGVSCERIARWNGSNWSPLGTGMGGGISPLAYVSSLTTLPNGDLVAGGNFASAGGASCARIARWNGTNWSALGTGMSGVFPASTTVSALTTLLNGDLVAGGNFTVAGGASAPGIALWAGSSWSALGTGMSGGTSSTGTAVHALTALPNGDLVAGGNFFAAGGVGASCIARWDGTSWSALGSGMSGIQFARTEVRALGQLPNGDLVAGGSFTAAGGVGASSIARWNGSSWSAFDSGIDRRVFALTMHTGELVAGGGFIVAGPTVCYRIARLESTCPAATLQLGTGCTGSGGPNLLLATTLPWTGSTFSSVATGMPANGLALGVLGFQAISIPLSAILPQGVPGCSVFVIPDLLSLHMPMAGSVETLVPIPDTVALAGLAFHQQVVPVELGPPGITAMTSTNALTLTIGSF